MYERHQRPLVRVVRGLSTSWEVVVTSMYHQGFRGTPAWSPCNRFLAAAPRSGAVEIRDAVTLSLLNTFNLPPSELSLSRLSFSPDSRLLTYFNKADLVTWDLQTGSLIGGGAILPEGLSSNFSDFSSAYSTDGKMLAAVYLNWPNTFIATHDSSTTHAHLYRVPQKHLISPIWTHGEFLRFATLERRGITIWEAEFALTQTPEEVESLPAPDKIADAGKLRKSLFLPTLSRLAMAFEHKLLIWDARNSKFLLKIWASHPFNISFSSDGRFFAHEDRDDVRVWKESPTGYVLHQQLGFHFLHELSLSPNGESITASASSTTHLWHTKNPILPSDFTKFPEDTPFFLEFSPHEASAAFGRYNKTVVTILDLQSGDSQLEIDVVDNVDCLRITEGSIFVVSSLRESVSTWNFATKTTTAVTRDRNRIARLDPSPSRAHRSYPLISMSPDLSRIATAGWIQKPRSYILEIYDAVTGRYLASAALSTGVSKSPPTPDGATDTK